MQAIKYKPLFRNSQDAFNNAISIGQLNTNPKSIFYAGNWMYMHTEPNGDDAFKNIMKRNYISVLNKNPLPQQD